MKSLKIKELMVPLADYATVSEDATLYEVEQLVMGQHQSLLVTDQKGDITGILRLTDVFSTIAQIMHACGIA